MNNVSNYAIAIILCLQAICQCVITTVGQYIYASYLDAYLYPINTTQNFSEIINSPFNLLQNISTNSEQCEENATKAQIWAQEQSADLFFRISLWNACPMILMTYVLGLYTPKLGRRFVLVLPMLGTMGQLAIWLAIIYFHLPDFCWYIASFIVGLSGSTYVLNFVLSLIVTDNTKENERSSRFVLFEAITTSVSAAATLGIGYYINWRGFTDLYWISLGLEILSITIVIFFFKNNSQTSDETRSLLSSSSETQSQSDIDVQIKQTRSLRTKCEDCLLIFKVFGFKNRPRRKSISLLLTLFAYIFYLLAYSTYSSFLWYLLDNPFCWSSENVGNYSALSSICSAVFSYLGMKLFMRLGVNDIIICTFSHLCFAGSSLWIAFAKHSWQLYAGLSISPYADYQNSLTLPMMSKWLESHERNHAFTFVAAINTIIITFGESFFNWVYGKTVANVRNCTLLIAVGFSIVSFILNICLLGVTRKMPIEESVLESEPVLLPKNNIVHPGDIIHPSLSHPLPLPQATNKDKPRMNSQSSTDDKMISATDLIIL